MDCTDNQTDEEGTSAEDSTFGKPSIFECEVVLSEQDPAKHDSRLEDSTEPQPKRPRGNSISHVTGSDNPSEAHSTQLPEISNRWRCSPTREGDLEDADLCFFKSLSPDLKKMTPRQKNRFRVSVLNCIDDVLYKDVRDENSFGSYECTPKF